MISRRWWSIIMTTGLFMALGPLGAQAGPNRPFAPQPNRQAFARPQPRGNAYGLNGPHRQWNQQRNANARNGHQRQWQHPRGNTYGWNGQHRQWNQQRNAYGQNGHQRQWQQPRGNAYGWNGQQRQLNQQRNAYGQNGQPRQWQQPNPSVAQGNRPGNRQFQPPNGGQQHNPASSYNRAGYPPAPQSPNPAPGAPGYSHNTTTPAGQPGAQPGLRHPDASGNTLRFQSHAPSGVIRLPTIRNRLSRAGKTDPGE